MADYQIYLAGPMFNGDRNWATELEKVEIETPLDINWVDPFKIHDDDATGMEIYERDREAVLESDVMLLRRIDDYEICGAYIETGFTEGENIETVVWNEADSKLPEFLRWHSESSFDNLEDAVNRAIELL